MFDSKLNFKAHIDYRLSKEQMFKIFKHSENCCS